MLFYGSLSCVNLQGIAGRQPTQQRAKPPGAVPAKMADKILAINSRQPTDADNDWSAAMETELQDLTGQFDQLKRDSTRPVLQDVNSVQFQHGLRAQQVQEGQAAEHTGCLPQSVTRQILQPSKAAPSIADRLQALRKGTNVMENELQSLASQVPPSSMRRHYTEASQRQSA